jgi:hypothetical protein
VPLWWLPEWNYDELLGQMDAHRLAGQYLSLKTEGILEKFNEVIESANKSRDIR